MRSTLSVSRFIVSSYHDTNEVVSKRICGTPLFPAYLFYPIDKYFLLRKPSGKIRLGTLHQRRLRWHMPGTEMLIKLAMCFKN
ncbi:MAG: hypothetical protein WAO19_02925 [Candidatus Kryptoniota bacterium]